MSKYHFTIGFDPEFMVKNKTGIVSAIPIVSGNKTDKTDLGNGFECFHDNVLLETNIPPANSKKDVLSNIKSGISRIATFIKGDYELVAQASHDFSKEECEHQDAKIVGCSVEFCAYEMAECTPPSFVGTKRSAGGHIHLGRSDFKDFVDFDATGNCFFKDGVDATGEVLIDTASKVEVIKLMDLFVGTSLVLIDKDPTSAARKTLYGKAGRLRPTPYGVEYRTPSNYWLSSPKLAELVFDLSMHALKIAESGEGESMLSQFDSDDIRKAIDENDTKLAELILKMALDDAPSLLKRVFGMNKVKVSSLYKEWQIN